jgi:drug/metabolite transporter (DMT)-like permease
MRTHAVHTVLACLVVYILWGTTYPAINVMLTPPEGHGIPPFLATGGRLAIAGLILITVGQFSARGRCATRDLTVRQFRAAFIAGLFLCFTTAALVAAASQRLPSGAVASYLATAPIWATILLSATSRTPPKFRVGMGLVVGLGGVTVLSGSSITSDPSGVLLALAAAGSWAFGSWYTAHSKAFPTHNFISGGLGQLTSGVALLGVALVRSEHVGLSYPQVSNASLFAFAYLTFVSLAGLTAYSWLLKNRDPLLATSHAFINPLVAAVVGAVVLREGLSVELLMSAVLVGGGAFLTMPMANRARRRRITRRACVKITALPR